MWHVRGRGDLHTGFLWRNLTKRENFQYPGVDVRVILKLILKKYDGNTDWLEQEVSSCELGNNGPGSNNAYWLGDKLLAS